MGSRRRWVWLQAMMVVWSATVAHADEMREAVLLPGFAGLFLPEQTPAPQQPPAPPQPRKDTRSQYPKFLSNAYVTVAFGSINYPFSDLQLEPGFAAERVEVPHAAVRLVLFGYRFHKYLSGQVSYMRPAKYVVYRNVNGDQIEHKVGISVGEISLKTQVPLTSRFDLYGEVGASTTSRKGFVIDRVKVVDDTHVASLVLSSGFEYHVNRNWDLLLGLSYAGAHARHRQPETIFTSTGFRFNMRPAAVTDTAAAALSESPYIFPEYTVQLGFSTAGLGYGANTMVSTKVPIFWGGDVEASNGLHLRFQRNVFHTRKIFSFDIGGSVGYWKSQRNRQGLVAISAYPLFRFSFLRKPSADYYVSYSVAGPTLTTAAHLDDYDLGTYFTFQDMLGVGAYFGKNRNYIAEVSVGHYSNGNLFNDNPGTKIPLTFSLGYAF